MPKHEDIDLTKWRNPDLPAWTTLEVDSTTMIARQREGRGKKDKWFILVRAEGTMTGYEAFPITVPSNMTDGLLKKLHGKKHLCLRAVTHG